MPTILSQVSTQLHQIAHTCKPLMMQRMEDKVYKSMTYRIVGNFLGRKFRGIASEGTRRNFCGFNFCGTRTHREARHYRYSASGNFRDFPFSRKPNYLWKWWNFAPCENFPLYSIYMYVVATHRHQPSTATQKSARLWEESEATHSYCTGSKAD